MVLSVTRSKGNPVSFSVSRRFFGATAAGLLLALVTSTGAMAAPRPITFDIFIGDLCVSGLAKSNSFLKVLIRDKAGNLKGRGAVETDPDGNWSACMNQGSAAMSPGDKVDVTDFETHQHRAFTVPLLTGQIDRGTNVVSGKAPPAQASRSRRSISASTCGASSTTPFSTPLASTAASPTTSITRASTSRAARASSCAGTTATTRSGPAASRSRHTWCWRWAAPISPAAPAQRPDPDHAAQRLTTVATGNAVGAYADTTFYGDFADEDGETYRPQSVARRSAHRRSAPRRAGACRASAAGSTWPGTRSRVAASTTAATSSWQARGLPEQGFGFGTAAADGSFTLDLADQVDITEGLPCRHPVLLAGRRRDQPGVQHLTAASGCRLGWRS